MKKLTTAIFALTMMLSVAFIGQSISSTGTNPYTVSAQTVTIRRTSRNIGRRAYRGGRWVVRKTWNGSRWVYRRVWVGTRWTGRKAWRGTKKVGRTIRRVVY
ncbi:MAG TPA: hypothetical protein VJ781_10310 [Pyrinomonadaceae bacterium]|nr:hypothetical protein [Pyrinomonadaceae bacterium]